MKWKPTSWIISSQSLVSSGEAQAPQPPHPGREGWSLGQASGLRVVGAVVKC